VAADAGGPRQPFSVALGPARLHSALDCNMKLVRYIAAVIASALAFLVVAGVLTALLGFVFPSATDHNVFGDWRSYPGTITGILFGYWLFRAVATPKPNRV
jgi:hypothetical protein